jgi:hypothetical protein
MPEIFRRVHPPMYLVNTLIYDFLFFFFLTSFSTVPAMVNG